MESPGSVDEGGEAVEDDVQAELVGVPKYEERRRL